MQHTYMAKHDNRTCGSTTAEMVRSTKLLSLDKVWPFLIVLNLK